MKKISIVIPAYNAEETIEKAVASVLAQTVPKEIIVVDDGSTDRTPEILDGLAQNHPEVRVIHQRNAGVSAARNAGIDAATGAWLMTLDDDDYIDDAMLESMATAAEKDVCDLAVCGMKLQFENRTESYTMAAFVKGREAFLEEKMVPLYDRHLLTTHSNKLYDLSLIRQRNLRYDEELLINEDIDFVLRYLKHMSRAVFLEETYLNYVQHAAGGSLITTFRKNGVRSSIRVAGEMEELYPFVSGDTKEQLDRRMLVHILSFAGTMYYRGSLSDAEKKEELRRMADDEVFRRLLGRTKPKDMKTAVAKALLTARLYGLYHIICRRLYRGCN